jgi:uncharacterized protein YxjI
MIYLSNINNFLEAKNIVLKKKILSLWEHYDFETIEGKKLGEADANLIQLPAKFNVHDQSGAEVFHIEGVLISLRPQYIIRESTGAELGTITKKLVKLIGTEFWVEKNGVEFMRIYGDFTEHEYNLVVDNVQVASVHRKWISIRDQLEISITGEVDHRVVLGAVTVIEHISFTERQNKASLSTTASKKAKKEKYSQKNK